MLRQLKRHRNQQAKRFRQNKVSVLCALGGAIRPFNKGIGEDLRGVIARKDGKRVRLYSRLGNDLKPAQAWVVLHRLSDQSPISAHAHNGHT